MPYNLSLEKRITAALELFPQDIKSDIQLKKMFGGLAFLYRGKMTVGIIKDELAVRVVSERMKEVLEREEVRRMDFTKKPMKEFIYVSPVGFQNEEELMYWIELGLEHAKRKLNLH
ncbi:MAG: TfoX/Sxy family protein [Flavobacteriaceae bacterium]